MDIKLNIDQISWIKFFIEISMKCLMIPCRGIENKEEFKIKEFMTW